MSIRSECTARILNQWRLKNPSIPRPHDVPGVRTRYISKFACSYRDSSHAKCYTLRITFSQSDLLRWLGSGPIRFGAKPMSCKACGSPDQIKFPTEINIHPPPLGLKNMDKPTVRASPTVLVCSNCGFAEFVLKDDERNTLEEIYREIWANGREFSA